MRRTRQVIGVDERNALLGEERWSRFGHGSNDAAIVYIRNDQVEIIYEVVRSPISYAEEVHGFSHDDAYRGNLERMRARERDEREDNLDATEDYIRWLEPQLRDEHGNPSEILLGTTLRHVREGIRSYRAHGRESGRRRVGFASRVRS